MVTTMCCYSHRATRCVSTGGISEDIFQWKPNCCQVSETVQTLTTSVSFGSTSSAEMSDLPSHSGGFWQCVKVCDDSLPSPETPTWRPMRWSQNQCTSPLSPVEVLLQQVQPLLHLSVREVHVALVLAACCHCRLLSSLTRLRPLFQAELWGK